MHLLIYLFIYKLEYRSVLEDRQPEYSLAISFLYYLFIFLIFFYFQCVLDRVNQWPFNAFILDNVTGGKLLPIKTQYYKLYLI